MTEIFRGSEFRLLVQKIREESGVFYVIIDHQVLFMNAPWLENVERSSGFSMANWRVADMDHEIAELDNEIADLYNEKLGVFAVHIVPPAKANNFDTLIYEATGKIKCQDFDNPALEGEDFARCLKCYRLLKFLYNKLDCDEVVGTDINLCDILDFAHYDPQHRHKMFRFAKQGTQVLIKSMEAGHPMPNMGPDDIRIFIDP